MVEWLLEEAKQKSNILGNLHRIYLVDDCYHSGSYLGYAHVHGSD